MRLPSLSKLFIKDRFDHKLALSLMLSKPNEQALPPSPPLCEAEIFDVEWSPSMVHKLKGYLGEKEN